MYNIILYLTYYVIIYIFLFYTFSDHNNLLLCFSICISLCVKVHINPNKGVLAALESCSVDVVFRAMHCQVFESVLQLSVLNGTGW